MPANGRWDLIRRLKFSRTVVQNGVHSNTFGMRVFSGVVASLAFVWLVAIVHTFNITFFRKWKNVVIANLLS